MDAKFYIKNLNNPSKQNNEELEIPKATATKIGGITIGNINPDHATQMGAAPYHSLLFTNFSEGEDADRLGFKVLSINNIGGTQDNISKEDFANILGIEVSEVDSIFYGGFIGIRVFFSNKEFYYLPLTFVGIGGEAFFGIIAPGDFGCMVKLKLDTTINLYSITVIEM